MDQLQDELNESVSGIGQGVSFRKIFVDQFQKELWDQFQKGPL